MNSNSIGIIGAGAVATHFAHYFSLKKIPFSQWSRRTKNKFDLKEFINSHSIFLILIKDCEIEPFILSHPELLNKTCVHFSGSLVTSLAIGMHPLMTFTKELYELAVYESIAFIGELDKITLADILPELKNKFYAIPQDKKAFYHSLCVMSGNFTVLLWQKIFNEFNSNLNLPLSAVYPYMQKIFENLSENPFQSLTGPIPRNDIQTIEKNLQALEGDAFRSVYLSFLNASKLSKGDTNA